MDYSKELPPIPLCPLTTATETTVSAAVTVPVEILDAWDAWRSIKDEDERRRVGANIARRMAEMNGQ